MRAAAYHSFQLSGVAVVHVGEPRRGMARFLAHRDQRLPVSVQVSHLLCVGRADRVVKSLGDRKCTEHPRQQGSPRQLISTTVGVLTGVVRLVCPRMQKFNIDKHRYSLRTWCKATVVDLTIKSPCGRLEGITGDHGHAPHRAPPRWRHWIQCFDDRGERSGAAVLMMRTTGP